MEWPGRGRADGSLRALTVGWDLLSEVKGSLRRAEPRCPGDGVEAGEDGGQEQGKSKDEEASVKSFRRQKEREVRG